MARMVECSACGGPVASTAGSCPSCGASRTRVGNSVAVAGLVAVVAVFVLLVIYAAGHYQG